MTSRDKRQLVDSGNKRLSVSRQCKLLGLARSSYYYKPRPEAEIVQRLRKEIFEIYMQYPFYGVRRMMVELNHRGFDIGKDKVRNLMREMNIKAIYPGRKTTTRNPNHEVFPYLLRDFEITRTNQVWSCDITYIKMRRGFIYVTAIIDWHSRYVLAWRVSPALDAKFCLEALEEALSKGKPDIFNTDQGSQFTCRAFVDRLKKAGIQISMDGRGRAIDNAKSERLWWALKHEETYLFEYETISEAKAAIDQYFEFYNKRRWHQSLGHKTPASIHFA